MAGQYGTGIKQSCNTIFTNYECRFKTEKKYILLFAEDSSTYPGVTAPTTENGLAFDYKWDMGWMNDTLTFFQSPPEERTDKYHKLTFYMYYFYNERFILPLSHDEVVHGKATIVQKMNGEYKDKFPQAKALYLYMFAHHGKKLNFMGNELGTLRGNEDKELDWNILSYPIHDEFHYFIRDLNKIYLSHSALYEMDYKRYSQYSIFLTRNIKLSPFSGRYYLME